MRANRWIVAILVTVAGLGALPAQAEVLCSVERIQILDSAQSVSCSGYNCSGPPYPCPGTIHFKGDGDGVLEPGERIWLSITLRNISGFALENNSTFNGLTGQVSSAGGTVLHDNLDCNSGLLGARFPCPVDVGDTVTNLDPFILDVSQGAPCAGTLTFLLSLTYSPDGGPVRTQQIPISIPTRGFTDSFYYSPDTNPFSSLTGKELVGTATNGTEICLVHSDVGGFNYSIIDLDGNPAKDPTSLSVAAPSDYAGSKVLYNPANSIGYEVIYAADSAFPPNHSLYYLPLYGGSTPTSIGTGSFVGTPVTALVDADRKRLLVAYTDMNTYQMRLDILDPSTHGPLYFPPTPPPPPTSVWLGEGNVDGVFGAKCSLLYLPATAACPTPWYFVMWERHNGWAGGTHTLEIRRIAPDTMVMDTLHQWTVVLPPPSNSYDSSRTAQAAIAADPDRYMEVEVMGVTTRFRLLVVSWNGGSYPADDPDDLYITYLGEELGGASHWQVANSPDGIGAREPALMVGGDFFLAWREIQGNPLDGTQQSAQARIAEFDPFTGGWNPLQTEDLSRQWMGLRYINALWNLDRGYVLWSDHRDSIDFPSDLYFSAVRSLDPHLPMDMDPMDDQFVSTPYEAATFPSLASQGSEFMVAWAHREGISDPANIYYSRFYDDGVSIQEKQCISCSDPDIPSGIEARTVAQSVAGQYRIFWRGATDVRGWFGGGSPGSLVPLGDSCSQLKAAASGSLGDLVLYAERTSGDPCMGPYNLFASATYGSYAPLQLSSLSSGAYIKEVAAAPNPGNPNAPWVVAWVEMDATFHLRMALLRYDLTLEGAVVTLYDGTCSNDSQRYVALAANDERIAILHAEVTDAACRDASLSLRLFAPDGTPVGSEALDSYYSPMSSYDFFVYPRLRWNGTSFIASWLRRGPTVLTATQYHLVYRPLSPLGTPQYWPVKAASPKIRMGMAQGNFEVDTTDEGGVGAYFRDGSTMSSTIYKTLLSWPPEFLHCSMYNQAPTISTTGPYSVEFGNSVVLSGADGDDDRGDFVVSRGWDLSDDGVVDVYGNSVTLTEDLMVRNKIVAPKLDSQYYNIRFTATDSHGTPAWLATRLYVTDHTPPAVSVNYPNGGETLRIGQTVTVTWDGSDNYEVKSWDVSYCADYGASGGETWHPLLDASSQPATNLSSAVRSFDWVVPDILSATCRIKVVGTDASPANNYGYDISERNFYIVQMTTTAVRTLILYNSARTDAAHEAGASGTLLSKLTELAYHTKVNGAVLDLNNVTDPDPLKDLQLLYAAWDDSSEDLSDEAKRLANVNAANAVAQAVRTYVTGLVGSTYTNAQYLVLAGDDRIIPFYRVPDGTAISPESSYPTINVQTPVGAALERKYYLTDSIFGDMDPDTTSAGLLEMYLPDLATGRLVEEPEEIAGTINAFIAQDGQINLNKVYITGYDFLQDSATTMSDSYTSKGKTVLSHIGDSGWNGTTMDTDLFTAPVHALAIVNNHCDHANIGTPDSGDPLTALEIGGHTGTPLRGTLLYSVGCHSGLSAPDDQFSSPLDKLPLDLPQAFLRKGVEAYIGNTGYGWGLKYGSGYSERLAEMITNRIIGQSSIALGKALIEAKRDYYLQDHRYDVFDEKILFESTLYGLPMYQVMVNDTLVMPPRTELEGPGGPDEQEVAGISLSKTVLSRAEALPANVTEVTLSFTFGTGTYTEVQTADGVYLKLNGRASAELGDTLQPYFTYDSRLSGTVSHGVLFTGGTFTSLTQDSLDHVWEPVVGTADSSTYTPAGESPIGPMAGSFIPTVNATNPEVSTSLTLTDLSRMTVNTGYWEQGSGVETRFDQMGFVVYYHSNSSDRTAPAPPDPGETGSLHTLIGLTANFSLVLSDDSGIYRAVVTYTDRVSKWQSFDLAYNSGTGKWEGSLTCRRNLLYYVQVVDNAGNVGYLKKTGADLVFGGGPTGSQYAEARMFKIDLNLTDTDTDGMPDVWEDANGLNKAVNDSAADPDQDLLTNIQEFDQDTHPNNGDTDGDGDNDGSEVRNGRDPKKSGDGKRIRIDVTDLGGQYRLDWPDTKSGSCYEDNCRIDGPYWVYRSQDPHIDRTDALDAVPLGDGIVTYTDAAPPVWDVIYYLVSNVYFPGSAPQVFSVNPYSGPLTGFTAITITGTGFMQGCTVTIGGKTCTQVSFLNANAITCLTPPETVPGAKEVRVTNPNSQFGSLASGFTYYTNPVVNVVYPNHGPQAGGTDINIYGLNFVAGAAVTIGGNPAQSVIVWSTSWITCKTPAGTAGAKNVTVTNPNAQAGTLAAGFTYDP